jgi:Uma2 family endonuclease
MGGRLMGESPSHFDNLSYLVWQLEMFFVADPLVFVAGNMFVYYVLGDRNRHLSPDVFVVHRIPKHRIPRRRRYLVWEEGKGPDVVIEVTSASTREEDMDDKMALYREVLRVPEYFLFDPLGEYLEPRLQGYGLIEGRYQPIARVKGRLPSEILGLHLEPMDDLLRLWDPATGRCLPTPTEKREARLRAEVER